VPTEMTTLRPHKVLFDSCLWHEAVTHEYYMVPRQIEWPKGHLNVSHVAELKPRILRRKTLRESSEIFEAMQYVAKLAQAGRIRLYDTTELMFEWMGRAGGPSMRNTEFDLFRDIKIVRLKISVERTIAFSGFDSKDHFKKQKEIWLEGIKEPRFMELKRVINRKHWADAFHLWTAEVNGLDFVLTFETKVRKALANQKRLTTTVEILNPFELAERFCIGYRLKRKWRSLSGRRIRRSD
jgi:hypothetical protein